MVAQECRDDLVLLMKVPTTITVPNAQLLLVIHFTLSQVHSFIHSIIVIYASGHGECTGGPEA